MSPETSAALNPGSLLALNLILAIIIFGVSLGLKPVDFIRVARKPKAPVVGLLAQFLILPALTCLATWQLQIDPALALGMMLVAACPGGSFSNVMTFIARGNVATSISMTAVSSLAAIIMTPFNFALYASLNPYTRPLLQDIALDPWQIVVLFVFVIGIPLVLGMLIGHHVPRLAQRLEKPFRNFSVLALFAFVGLGIFKNRELLPSVLGLLALLVIAHNLIALLIGQLSARTFGLPEQDKRAVTLEVGIQNSGLALSILFTFFPGQGAMILVAALWGVWHLITGLGLALWWSARDNRLTGKSPELQG
ncbi:bile acid:sodium symporter family protein [Parendozoicomonas haliclonae]|uniref:Sodium Bile acid symporter family protein n=1 Tax=Parendozoicomonas haliclonae TaxID=1960125 RepID=A0A1X7AP02_9GAMM|nr:bile acid:sodium symporter family protein [Parendozoicomonas haliclonae]SMA49828.1 Sodium Bile acid symporter family protein [Parendozoicomonas haliclonae]